MRPVLQGQLTLPGDKSISHRALMLLSIARGTAMVHNLSSGQDVQSTLRCMQALGCKIRSVTENMVEITGTSRLVSPHVALDCGNSGTTIRLLSGLLSGAGVTTTLTGDESLCKRPMKRVIEPLAQMGASLEALGDGGCAPIRVSLPATGLHRLDYMLPMASAQVKSAILLAGLFAPREAEIRVREALPSRDHTERMLTALGASVTREAECIRLIGRQPDLVAQTIQVPGDISSGAFWLVGAAILPGSRVCLRQVSLNPTRLGVLDVLESAGVELTLDNVSESAGEPYGDIAIVGDTLQGDMTITPEQVPMLIDEIPILTVLGLFTQGTFTVRGAEELRVKESDRLGALISLLKTLRVEVTAYEDGFSFQGDPNWQVPIIETPIHTHHDHRLVMAIEILNLRAAVPIAIEGREWAAISYPMFFQTLETLRSLGARS